MKRAWVYRLESLPLSLIYQLFAALPFARASGLGSWLGRSFGPLLPVSRDALAQLGAILPKLPEPRRREIVRGVWENLGRFAGELPHVNDAEMPSRITVSGAERIAGIPGPYLFVSGHLGNWELLPGVLKRLGHPIHLLYRPSNNPYVEAMIQRLRGTMALGQLAKGKQGARGMHRAVKAGESLGILVDQKENGGIALPFFGVEAMTGTLPARLALDHGLPLVPVRVTRLPGLRFEVELEAPILPEPSGARDADVVRLMGALHVRLEEWIRAHPEQWFWVHHRWPRAIYRKTT